MCRPLFTKKVKGHTKKAVRCISHSNYNAHTVPLFKKLNIMPIETLVKYNKLQIIFDFINEELSKYFDNKWITVQQRTNRITWSSSEFHIPNFRIKLVSSFPKWSFPEIWNSFEAVDIKVETSRSIQQKA